MKAISLWQPWAQFVALGLKVNETRSWYTSFRGPIAIHAAQRTMPSAGRKLLERVEIILDQHIELTYGAIIAVVDLRGVHLTDSYSIPNGPVLPFSPKLPNWQLEYEMGDYSKGRYAWLTTRCRPLPTPVPCVGRQRIFNTPPNVSAAVIKQLHRIRNTRVNRKS
jgi:hypothetical protein